jgi:hypothetical protein
MEFLLRYLKLTMLSQRDPAQCWDSVKKVILEKKYTLNYIYAVFFFFRITFLHYPNTVLGPCVLSNISIIIPRDFITNFSLKNIYTKKKHKNKL